MNMLIDIPELRGTTALETLMNFYEDLGWDREKTLDSTKVKMNEEDWHELFDKIGKIGEKEGIGLLSAGFLVINKGPGIDDSVPKGKVLWEA